jgi:hypothetical protein
MWATEWEIQRLELDRARLDLGPYVHPSAAT